MEERREFMEEVGGEGVKGVKEFLELRFDDCLVVKDFEYLVRVN